MMGTLWGESGVSHEMSYRGRVLVIEETPRPETRLLWDGIRAEGWDVHAVPLARTVDQTVAGHPDLVVLNLAGAGGDVARTRYLDAAARMSLMRATSSAPPGRSATSPPASAP